MFATQRSSQLLTGLIYPWIIRILSVCLYVFGAIVWLTNQFIKTFRRLFNCRKALHVTQQGEASR